MSTLSAPKNRSELIALLTEACELEHGLACSYLYAAFSLKQHPIEGGLTTEQAHQVKLWASQIFFVASQEMLHLAQAWNLLTAIGGTPYCLRPNLPQNSRYYPLHARIALEPFGVSALKRFIVYETPAHPALTWVARQASFKQKERDRGHVSIGELYGAIAAGFGSIGGLFVGDSGNQVDRNSVQFPDLVPVHDTVTALKAINQITDQGEGTRIDRQDCHFGIFLRITQEYERQLASAGRNYSPVRPVMDNPVAHSSDGYGAQAHPIKDPKTRDVALLFDDVYALMLQALAFGFVPVTGADAASRTCAVAIQLMTTAIRPLGDAVTMLPSGVGRQTGGPGFGITRFVTLAAEPPIAIALIEERLRELAGNANQLAEALPATPQLAVAGQRMLDIARRLAN